MLINNLKDFGSFVRSQRKALNLSQAQVGESVGLKQGTISEFENKPDGTKLETLFRILSATNLEIHLIPKEADEQQKNTWDQPW